MHSKHVHHHEAASLSLTVGQCATLACLLEVTTPKPGNVHRGADFEDLTFTDFMASAVAIAPAMQAAGDTPLGETVLSAVTATRRMVKTNTNLGTILLLAPLASVPRDLPLAGGVARVLARLDADDASLVYDAIGQSQPGGLGCVNEMDIAGPPPQDLIAAMRAAADRDLVARQYTNNFSEVLARIVPWLSTGLDAGWKLTDTIIHTYLRLMSQLPDSLIARKCGLQLAQSAAGRAAKILESGSPGSNSYLQALADFDFWLRSDGHRRNPGTSADMIAAGLFVLLRDGVITESFQ